jgi:hypothetical protein
MKLKSIFSENNKITKAISVLLLIVIMFGLFAFIIAGLYRFDLIEFPAFIMNIFFRTGGEDSETRKDDKNIYEFLHNHSDSAESGNSNAEGYILNIR